MKGYESPKAEYLQLDDVITASGDEFEPTPACIMCSNTANQDSENESPIGCLNNFGVEPTQTKTGI